MDKQQVEAVVACEDAQLVLASAGSGKTLSLLAKVDYAVNGLKIDPAKILVISFTKKTVAELRERCEHKNVEIRTFHSLGNSLLQFANDAGLGCRKLITEEEARLFVESFLRVSSKRDSSFARKLNDYILFYASSPRAPGCFASHAEKIKYNRVFLRASLRRKVMYDKAKKDNKVQNTQTLEGSEIRSKDEQLLVNWLFINQLSYGYKPSYPPNKNYHPQFRIGDVYLDFASVNARGESNFGAQYRKSLEWRRSLHFKEGTKYIELPSCEWQNGKLFLHLSENLRLHGVQPKRMSESRIYSLITTSYVDEYASFVSQLVTFLSLYKNNLHELDELRGRIERFDTEWERRRANQFLDIFAELFVAYENFLAGTRRYDFADMINEASRTVAEVTECASNYEYILLDEVQDLSKNRLVLIREILRKCPKCRLFAVGDDWQSIYRFTGSNLELIQRFGEFFERKTRRSLIETTHRFGAPTVKLSSNFVQKNPLQARKKIRGSSKRTPIEIIFVEPEDNVSNKCDAPALDRVLMSLCDEFGYEAVSAKELQIISRYNHDINRLKAANTKISKTLDRIEWHNPENESLVLSIDYCSIHKSKGITRDIVIVLNMNDDIVGMPAKRETDPLVDTLLSDAEPYAFAEERRLFYVAITRAREATYLIAQRKTPSPFLFELSEELRESIADLCPRCGTGILVSKKTKNGVIRYCSNYLYGCEYIKH